MEEIMLGNGKMVETLKWTPSQGTFTFPNGKKYVGEWKEGRKDGQGTDIFPDGSKGIGEFREGRPWNITHRDKNGNIIVKFVNGKQIRP